MMLDKNGKLFGIISLLDVAVLLFLIFAVGAAVYSMTEQSASDTLLLTLTCEDLTEEVATNLAGYTGDFTDSDGNRYTCAVRGEAVQNVRLVTPTADPAEHSTPAPSDAPTTAPVEEPIADSFDLTLYLSTPGEETDDYFKKADGKPLSPGDVLLLEGAGTRIRMIVSAVDKR